MANAGCTGIHGLWRHARQTKSCSQSDITLGLPFLQVKQIILAFWVLRNGLDSLGSARPATMFFELLNAGESRKRLGDSRELTGLAKESSAFTFLASSSVGRAPDCYSGGRRFESFLASHFERGALCQTTTRPVLTE